MSYKNENMKMIELHENGLDIRFRIRENGVVELADFSSQEVKKSNHGAEGGYLLPGC